MIYLNEFTRKAREISVLHFSFFVERIHTQTKSALTVFIFNLSENIICTAATQVLFIKMPSRGRNRPIRTLVLNIKVHIYRTFLLSLSNDL